jgi:hypothetical protein
MDRAGRAGYQVERRTNRVIARVVVVVAMERAHSVVSETCAGGLMGV